MKGIKQVFKCFSKGNGAQKLITNKYQLEKADLQHRYEPNLKVYEDEWKRSKTKESFFEWLDSGEGSDLDLAECPRADLQRQCVRYLTVDEREEYEVVVERGMLVYSENGEFVNTTGSMNWIYILSPTKKLFVAEKVKGTFHHSSFLDGGDVLCAGHLDVRNGKLKALSASSGHYKPTEENFRRFKQFLSKEKVDLKDVKIINALS